MRRVSTLFAFALAASISAFGQMLPDPNIMVGASGATCPTGCSGDPTLIASSGFTLFSNGSPTADVPWYILLALPGTGKTDAQGGTDPAAPSITGTGFTISSGVDAGDFLPTTSGDIYAFASADDGGLNGDGSMNATNLFGSAETTAFGKTPSFFDIFVYTVSAGALTGDKNFSFTTSLPLGTFVGGLGIGSNGTQPFSTPFTTAGLVDATTTGPGTASGPASGPLVPEPNTIVLLGTVLLAACAGLRKKLGRA